jgi:5'-AMP-activated protein kinase, catalytic alpha subunit
LSQANHERNPSSPASKPFKNIGHYIIGRTLGEGTFGKVKEGLHIHTGMKVAIKMLEKERIKDLADVERVAREIHILKVVRHPNLIQMFEIIETAKFLYLIMEFCPGGELFAQIVSRKRLRDREASKYLNQIVNGIEYLHRLRICH